VKFPRISHLPWSQGISKDDLISSKKEVVLLANKVPLIYTEKLDGECTFFSCDRIHARSEDNFYRAPWQHWVKREWSSIIRFKIPDKIGLFCESLYAIHSIEYEELSSYLFLFGAIDLETKMYLKWNEVIKLSLEIGLPTVPLLSVGELVEKKLPEKSSLGCSCEGYTVRNAGEFGIDDFSGNIAKFVREGHVQTDEHWTKNWRKAKLKIHNGLNQT